MSAEKNLPPLPDGVTLEDLLIPLRAALETCHDTDWSLRQFKTSISHALAALAQQAQEPVALGVPIHNLRTMANGLRAVEVVNKRFVAARLDEIADYLRELERATPPAPQVAPTRLTCSGHRLVGGHMPDGSGHGEPCPDCNAPA